MTTFPKTIPKAFHVSLALCLAALAFDSVSAGFYANPHDLMVEAIRNGRASGVMGGDIAAKFKAQFKSRAPLLVEVWTLKTYRQPGCARLEVDYEKRDVPTPKGDTSVFLKTQINYCLDGTAPRSFEEQP
jgi:hypothetical protein